MTDFLISLGIPEHIVEALRLATLGRLLLASVLGGIIGMEREMSGKPAGLRTVLLICVGATLFTELSIHLAELGASAGGGFRGDPARLAAQIVPGIGFIGAGAILHGRGKVTGLTTAATLWTVTAIGIAVGSGAYLEAVGTTLLVLFTLFMLARFERWMARHRAHRRYVAAVGPERADYDRLEEALHQGKLTVRIEGIERRGETLEVHLRAVGPAVDHDDLFRRLANDPSVRHLRRG